MQRIQTLYAAIILGVYGISCSSPEQPGLQTQKIDSTTYQKSGSMKNVISIVEVPATDFPRAVTFYQAILNVTIEEAEMGGIQMGVVPSDKGLVSLVLVKGSDYKPTTSGAVVYLNAGHDLQHTLDKIEPNGGKVIVPKTEISPEMGFFALFTDTEGNKLGLHSSH